MTAKLLPLVPQHTTYCEVFGGGAALLFSKRPSPVEVYNDIDSALYEFFRVLADSALFEQFHRRVALLPYSRELYDECRATWEEQTDIVERVWRWYVVARQSFGGRFGGGWGLVLAASTRGMAETTSTWISGLAELPAFHRRVQRVQIEHLDWRRCLEQYDTPETFFYLDPPYVTETRSAKRYAHELTMADHVELVERVQVLTGMVMLSAYPHDLYLPLAAAGWDETRFETACYAAGRTRATGIRGDGAALRMQARTEVVWRNAACVRGRQERLL